jgi:hypothetical protein
MISDFMNPAPRETLIALARRQIGRFSAIVANPQPKPAARGPTVLCRWPDQAQTCSTRCPRHHPGATPVAELVKDTNQRRCQLISAAFVEMQGRFDKTRLATLTKRRRVAGAC